MDEIADPVDPTFDHPLQDLVTYRIVRLNALLNAQASKILKKYADMTPAQWRVIFILHDEGPMSSAQLVKQIGMDKGQLSRTIKGMIDKGWLKSKPNQSDHRSFELGLTSSGRTAFQKAQPHMRKRQNALMGSFSETERDVMYAAFDKIEDAVQQFEEDT